MEEIERGPVVAEMRSTFTEAKLAPPPIPAALAPGLRSQERWCWSTRPVDPMAMYMFGEYPAEVLLGTAPEYVAVSHAGHGVNSYAINYQLVLGSLAAFLQVPWGGVYMDAERAAADVRDRFEHLATLIDLATTAEPNSGPSSPVLLVLDSPFRRIRVCANVPSSFTDRREARRWLEEQPESPDPLEEAIASWAERP